MANFDQPIIIKKVKKNKHPHHGGAWKIAYADFVTAMMAFFLLLWLISMTTDEQKKGLADYFAPSNVSLSTSGAGGIMGGTALEDDGAERKGAALALKQDASVAPDATKSGAQDDSLGVGSGAAGEQSSTLGAAQAELKAQDDMAFQSAAASIKQAWQAMPDITELSDNLLVEKTEEGLDIQIIDQTGRPMFPEASKYPFEVTRTAIAVRTILGEFGLSDDHIYSVVGQSTTEPFFPNDPYMAANERIKITVLYEPPPMPPGMEP